MSARRKYSEASLARVFVPSIGTSDAMSNQVWRFKAAQFKHDVTSQVEAALSARCYPSGDVPELAARDRVAVVVRMLCGIVPRRIDGPVTSDAVATALHDLRVSPQIMLFRLAQATGAYRARPGKLTPPDFAAVLKADGSMAARCALALWRESVNWRSAPRELRAAVLLRAVCARMHGGLS